jgi:hypothetical protein
MFCRISCWQQEQLVSLQDVIGIEKYIELRAKSRGGRGAYDYARDVFALATTSSEYCNRSKIG